MADEPLYERSFLIPLRRDRNLSDEKPHLIAAWRWLDRELFPFGGATFEKGPLPGWYVDPDTGERVDDESKKFSVAVAKGDLFQLRAMLLKRAAFLRRSAFT